MKPGATTLRRKEEPVKLVTEILGGPQTETAKEGQGMPANLIAFLGVLITAVILIPICKKFTPEIFGVWLVWAAFIVGAAACLYLISDIFA